MKERQLFTLLGEAKEKILIIGLLPLMTDIKLFNKRFLNGLNNSPRITIIAESDNEVFAKSQSLDTAYSEKRIGYSALATKYKIFWDQVKENIDKDRLSYKHIHLSLPVYIIHIDGKTYFMPTTFGLPRIKYYQEVTDDSVHKSLILNVINGVLSDEREGKYLSDPGEELLVLYDGKKIPRGIYPRKSFYDTDYYQHVIWSFIFNREGKLLMHQRAENAKDNRGFWDKSVGGHVDWSMEISSHKTAVRETIEELFLDETNKEFMSYFNINEENFVFMGDWYSKHRKHYPYNEMSKYKREWVFFCVKEPQLYYSPRYLPDKTVRKLRVIADIFLFIANEELTEDKLKSFQNSTYRLVELDTLKNEIDTGYFANNTKEVFKASPDMESIMNGPIRNLLSEFNEYISLL